MRKWRPSKINNKWIMSTVIVAENCVAVREMKWWEKVVYCWLKGK